MITFICIFHYVRHKAILSEDQTSRNSTPLPPFYASASGNNTLNHFHFQFLLIILLGLIISRCNLALGNQTWIAYDGDWYTGAQSLLPPGNYPDSRSFPNGDNRISSLRADNNTGM